MRKKTAKWRVYKECSRQHGRNHGLAAAALAVFNIVNFGYRNFVKSKQCRYESSIVKRLATASMLFHSYVRKRKVCPSVGHLRPRV